ncbi:MAG: MBL fold metallo-hydrolase [Clostridia bacterium]
MNITWYGRSTFLIESSDGTRILTDPCNPHFAVNQHDIDADIVTVSHDHDDHNYIEAVSGVPIVFKTLGEHIAYGIKITGFPSFHDDCMGKKRGDNIMFIYEVDDMRILHCGDIGAIPDPSVISAMLPIDIMFVPTGGIYTIDFREARVLANLIKPSVLIPMHYGTGLPGDNLSELAPFLNSARDCKIHRLNQSSATIDRQNLGSERILVIDAQ